MRPGRNDPCPCGSGRKYKRCCIERDDPTPVPPPRFAAPAMVLDLRDDPPLTAVDRATVERIERELRGLPPSLVETLLGKLVALDGGSQRELVERVARMLCDDARMDRLIADVTPHARLALQFLVARSHARGDLVRLLALRGVPAPAIVIAEVCRRFPVTWSNGSRADLDRLSMFGVMSDCLERRLGEAPPVRHAAPCVSSTSPRSASPRLALALLPGVVMRARARITANGALHASAEEKLARTLPHAIAAVRAWTWAGALMRHEVLAIDLDRMRACASEPAALVRALVVAGADASGRGPSSLGRLVDLARTAPRGAQLSLGDALVWSATAHASGDDIETLVARLRTDGLATPWLTVDAEHDVLAMPPELHDAFTGRGATETRSYVQASYEILLAPNAPFGASLIAGLAAELVHVDSVARLRLTRESVLAACGVGATTEEILGALRAIAGERGVPVVVETAIREWGALVTRARVGRHVVLELDETSRALDRAAELLAPILVRRAAPHVLLLSREPDREALAKLAKLGITLAHDSPAPEDAPPALPVIPAVRFATEAHARDLRPVMAEGHALRESEAALAEAQLRTGVVPPVPSARRPPQAPEPPTPSARAAKAFKLPTHLAAAIALLRYEWRERSDWLRELDRIVTSQSFSRAVTTAPNDVAAAFTRGTSPQRLNLAVAKLLAGESVGTPRG